MANFNADTVATQRGKTKADAADNSTDRMVKPMRISGSRRSYYAVFVSAGEAIGSVVRMAFLPFGATIRRMKLGFEAQGAGALCSVGIIGASGTTYDNDADLFAAAGQDIAAAGALELPSAALAAAGTTDENKGGNYTITDPDGAYIILTTAGAVLGTTKDITLDVEYVTD